ncbi:hypothetical protein POM88_033211 [Heracleum sosnowskyi]|uniref:ATP-dependent DNA helicase n=1 Tax=Heracleum sosnowskyi TaxID=360622 RepID=A0AAD8I1N8_9APIA|nr:hypothetical protein POM88_050789 [Heracleum sosnowskyi]KAK1377018.1 hypothetical protein POM88_033211 [Heracleum sosnowskyi]
MRISKGKNEFEVKRMKAFAQWVLDIGDGKIDRALNGDAEEDIIIPSEFCNVGSVNSVDDMIESTFPDLIENYKDPKYLSERAILTPRNNTVFHVNGLIVEKIPGDSVSYFSVDSAEEFPGTTSDLNNSFPTEYLNSLNIPVSRVTSPEGLKFFIESEMGLPTNMTQNVVYKEVFQNLPSN